MRLCKDCKKTHEMVLASMEYVKTLGQRIRVTEEQGEIWKKTAQTHADECVRLRTQLKHLQDAQTSGMLPQLVHERDALRAERDALRAQLDTERKPKPVDVPRAHPVAVGEWVERTSFERGPNTKIGAIAKVVSIDGDGDYRVAINHTVTCWSPMYCTPCDPPTASHDTPAGKETAQAAAEPKPGDVVRLVRVPTNDEYPHDSGRWEPNWGGIGDYMRVHYVGSNSNGTRVVRAVFGLEWPLSCIEVVKGGE